MDFTQYGPTGAVVVVVLLFLNFIQKESAKRDIKDAVFTKTIRANTRALSKHDKHEEKNHLELLTATKAIPVTMRKIAKNQATAIINAVSVKKQTVNEQLVKHRTVKDRTA